VLLTPEAEIDEEEKEKMRLELRKRLSGLAPSILKVE
jgi:hypothetical protein